MNTFTTLLLNLGMVAFVGCAHVATSAGRFSVPADGTEQSLKLTITRHVDTIVNGPDMEEDQVLTLMLSGYALNVKTVIPSNGVKAHLTITRFGPGSTGEDFHGTITIKSVTPEKVVAHLDLEAEAYTENRSYKQTVRFKGEHNFRLE